MDTMILVDNVGITFDDNILAEDKEFAISEAIDFVKTFEHPLIHVYVYAEGNKIMLDYLIKITAVKNVEQNYSVKNIGFNKPEENIKTDEYDDADLLDEDGNLRIIGDWGDEEEPYTPPAPTPAYPDRSQEILKAMEEVAHQTERVADQLWWQSFNNSL